MSRRCGRFGEVDGEAVQCATHTRRWRQCPIIGCGFEVTRCDEHGGDARAVEFMKDHVRGHIEASAGGAS